MLAKSRRTATFLFAAALTVPAAAQISLPPSVDDSAFGPLLTGNVYLADANNVTVPSGKTLTIQPGVVVKFAANRQFTVSGTLHANGTAAQPIVFTSIKDDTAGGVTDPASPAPGDWRQISFGATAASSQIRNTIVRYAGLGGLGAVSLASGADIFMDGVAVELSGGAGLDGGGFASSNGSLPLVANCRFDDNAGPSVTRLRIDAVPGFSACTATGNAGGNPMRVNAATTTTSATICTDNLIENTLVLEQSIVVSQNDTLTLGPGVVLKFGKSALGLSLECRAIGALVADGSAADRVTFTSLGDDAVATDAAGDGPTAGAPGDWNGLVVFSDAASLFSADVRFAGAFQAGAITLNGSDATLVDVVVERSLSDGLSPTSTSFPTVLDSRFDDNLGRALSPVDWLQLPGMRDNAAGGNALGDHTVVKGGTFQGAARVDPWNALNDQGVVEAQKNTLVFVGSLTLGGGLVVKFSNPSDSGFSVGTGATLSFDGFGFAKVVLTSIRDDAFGGDTNGDGAAGVPAPGDWTRVTYGSSAGPARMNHVRVRYPGFSGTAGVELNAPSVSMDSVRVDFSATAGIRIDQNGGGLRNLVAFKNAGDGIVYNQGPTGLMFATSTENGGGGIVKPPGSALGANSCVAWNNPGGDFVNFQAGSAKFCDGIGSSDPNDGNFIADPLFVDPANGDLTPGFFSPLIMRADPFKAQLTGEDHIGNSRSADDNFSGFAQPDIGAYEVPVYRMQIDGFARIGETFTLRVEGAPILGNPPGTGLFFLGTGFDGVGIFTPHFGYLLVAGGGTVTFLFAFPTQTDLPLAVPDDPVLVGFPIGIQPLVQPLGNPNVGNWTNAFLGTIRE